MLCKDRAVIFELQMKLITLSCDYIEVPVKLLYPETEVATPMQKIYIKQLFIKVGRFSFLICLSL